jgi:hypothetical protein
MVYWLFFFFLLIFFLLIFFIVAVFIFTISNNNGHLPLQVCYFMIVFVHLTFYIQWFVYADIDFICFILYLFCIICYLLIFLVKGQLQSSFIFIQMINLVGNGIYFASTILQIILAGPRIFFKGHLLCLKFVDFLFVSFNVFVSLLYLSLNLSHFFVITLDQSLDPPFTVFFRIFIGFQLSSLILFYLYVVL